MSKRRKFTAEFKTKVVLEALKERCTLTELAQKHQLHPVQITNWKKDFLQGASSLFDKKASKSNEEDTSVERSKLFAKIGELQMEVDFLKDISKKL